MNRPSAAAGEAQARGLRELPMVRWAKQKLHPITSRLFSRATLVEGTLKGTAHPFRCLLVDNSRFTDYLRARMYDGSPAVLKERRIWIPALRNVILKEADSFDLCVAVLPRAYEARFRGLYDFRCTQNVRQIIDTSGSWEDVRGRFSRKKRQISNDFPAKHGLEYRISSDLGEFEFFYHRMHVPHILKRYGELSNIESYEEMKEFFLKGVLLLVTRDQKPVAGALCLVEDGTLIFRRTGVLDGDETHIDGGAQTALYYFQLRHANESGLRAVDTMKSWPCLDGVYKHKRDWGAAELPDDEADTWVYFFNARPSEKIARFFEGNPLIVSSGEGLKAVIGLGDATEVSAEAAEEIASRHRTAGLSGFTIVTRTGTRDVS